LGQTSLKKRKNCGRDARKGGMTPDKKWEEKRKIKRFESRMKKRPLCTPEKQQINTHYEEKKPASGCGTSKGESGTRLAEVEIRRTKPFFQDRAPYRRGEKGPLTLEKKKSDVVQRGAQPYTCKGKLFHLKTARLQIEREDQMNIKPKYRVEEEGRSV